MAAALGMELIAPGVTRKGVEMAMQRIVPAAAAPVARGVAASRLGPAALAYGWYETGKAAGAQGERDAERFGHARVPLPMWNPLLPLDVPTVPLDPRDSELTKIGPLVYEKTIRPRKASKFNKAISAGMKAVRSSKFMGKKGSISNSKKAFATVTKTVSALKKGRKRPTKGVRGTIARAARRYV